MKSVVMIVICAVVAAAQFFILRAFLKKIKTIEIDFWGESAEKAKKELEKARAEIKRKAEEAAAAEAEK